MDHGSSKYVEYNSTTSNMSSSLFVLPSSTYISTYYINYANTPTHIHRYLYYLAADVWIMIPNAHVRCTNHSLIILQLHTLVWNGIPVQTGGSPFSLSMDAGGGGDSAMSSLFWKPYNSLPRG